MTRLVLLLVAAVLLAGCGASGGGITGLETLHAFYRGDPTDDEKQIQVACPSKKKAVGGGFELAAGRLPIDVQFSEPMGQVGQAPAGCRPSRWKPRRSARPRNGASMCTPSAPTPS